MIYTYTIEEIEIGIADTTKEIKVEAERVQDASKKLWKYLQWNYEDKITLTPYSDYLKATFQRNAGHLVIRLQKPVQQS